MRLIDAEALEEKIENLITHFEARGKKQVAEDYNFVLTVLITAPTIKAKPVVYAYWNDDGRCTNCGGHAPFFPWTDEWFDTKFCPHCGAQIHKPISCNHEDDNHIAEDGKKGVKIPVISMGDVPKIMEEMEK